SGAPKILSAGETSWPLRLGFATAAVQLMSAILTTCRIQIARLVLIKEFSYLMMNSTRLIALALCLVATATAGCKKDASSSVSATQTNAIAPESMVAPPQSPPTRGPGPMPAPAGPAVVSDDGGVDAALTQLSFELRKYVVRT